MGLRPERQDGMKIFATIIGFVVLVAVMAVYGCFVQGFVISHLWDWFIVPTFGLKPLLIREALGLGLVTSYLTYQIQSKPKSPKGEIWDTTPDVLTTLLHPWMALLIGWIVHILLF